MSARDVMDLDEVDATHVALVGGKAANLGELRRIDGVRVPAGCCVTTDVFRRVVARAGSFDELLERLSALRVDDRDAIGSCSAEIRRAIEAVPVPDDVATAIGRSVAGLGADEAYAVRSSATAEDLPTASFAGQQDTYLDVVGAAAIVEHVRRCWASMFTERAVTYRMRNGIEHRTARMAVIVQRMVAADAAGTVFTADPVTSDRTVTTIEATPGLGDALVGGLVDADSYTVRDDEVVATSQSRPTLTDGQAVRLARLGRRIEAHFGRPQDIEWCLLDDDFHVVQSRPITTLFPVPVTDDDERHVYVSVGHQQMMTAPIRPLGLSVWQMTTARPMAEAGGRLFVDVADVLASPTTRDGFVAMWQRSDPLIGEALRTILDRGDVVPAGAGDGGPAGPPAVLGTPAPIDADPTIVTGLIASTRASVAAAQRTIAAASGTAVFDAIADDIREAKRMLFEPPSMPAIMAGMDATWWLNDHLEQWLGEKNAADVLSQSVEHNVTSEMGLALLDVADHVRPHPAVVAFLEHVDDDGFLDALPSLAGGRDARDAIVAYLDTYGMRCVGEIDITRPRWSERPSTLVPLILGNVTHAMAGEGGRRFERGRRDAAAKERDVLQRLRALPDGERKVAETQQMIDRLRTFIGYREYPKYGLVCRYAVYKQALVREAERLTAAGALGDAEDAFFLRFDELREAVRTGEVDEDLIRRRREDFRSYAALTPPRVMTSDGEVVTGTYRRADLPAGALVGLAVSAGTVEGRARVVHDLAASDVEPGDILVTSYTDPSWSPLFVAVAGVVTEVGGTMTHGAVIAREYGLPAVVSVERATTLIRDGQRIRVHGTEGYVELLDE